MITPHDNPAAAARLNAVRQEIEQIDIALVDLLARRLSCAAEIGALKEVLGLPVMDPAREAEVVRHAAELARERGIDPELARDVIWRVIAQARGVQGARAPAPDGD